MITLKPTSSDIDELAVLLRSRLKGRVSDLAGVLRIADATQRLADQLEATESINAASRRESVEELIQRIQKSAPEKAQLLQELHECFERKEILTTAASLRGLAQQLGASLTDGRRSRKNELAILAALSNLSVNAIRDVHDSLSRHPDDAPSSLQQWHDIITQNSRRATSRSSPPVGD